MTLPVSNALRYVSLELSLELHRHTVVKVELVGERDSPGKWNVPG